MKVKKNIPNILLLIIVIYFAQGAFYTRGSIISQIALLFILIISGFYWIKTLIKENNKSAFYKGWTAFLLLNIFGYIFTANLPDINNFGEIKNMLLVSLPFYPFFFFSVKNKIFKTGPHLCSKEKTIMPYLKQLNINMVTLANNHILDYGDKGLKDTFDSLNQNKIANVGAGNNIIEASKSFTLNKNGLKITFLNFAENEWSIATENTSGANPLNIIDNLKQIKKAKTKSDKVICIIHGGNEYYHLPSPRMVKQYRFYAENGADAIIGHHTHCISGYEIHKKVPIIYSLGNFIFTKKSIKDVWYNGLVVKLSIKRNEPVFFELFPIQQDKNTFLTTLSTNEKKKSVLKQIDFFNNIISEENKLIYYWNIWIKQHKNQYLSYFSLEKSIKNRFIRAFINRTKIGSLFLNKQYFIFILNIIRCEAHSNCLNQHS